MLVILAVNEHNIGRFDVTMDKSLAFSRNQRAGNLAYDTQRQVQPDRTCSLNSALHGFAIDKFHRIEETGVGLSQVEHARHVGVRKLCCRTSFTDKALFDGVAGDELSVND